MKKMVEALVCDSCGGIFGLGVLNNEIFECNDKHYCESCALLDNYDNIVGHEADDYDNMTYEDIYEKVCCFYDTKLISLTDCDEDEFNCFVQDVLYDFPMEFKCENKGLSLNNEIEAIKKKYLKIMIGEIHSVILDHKAIEDLNKKKDEE